MNGKCRFGQFFGALILAAAAMAGARSTAQSCQKIVLEGEVNGGKEWRASLGEGWVFRVLPVQPGKAGYSGWDLVVDREQPTGFPDALLLATPPYNSLNEHEVATTFGLRAQDAIGWNPRSFHFLSNVEAFREAQGIYRQMSRSGQLAARAARTADPRSAQRLMELMQKSSAGQFRILDARLAPGTSDAAPYAENWAINGVKTQHQSEPAYGGGSTQSGELHWMRFSITLWLPRTWKTPSGVHAAAASACE